MIELCNEELQVALTSRLGLDVKSICEEGYHHVTAEMVS